MFVQASSTADFRSKQKDESAPARAHASATNSRRARRFSRRAGLCIASRMRQPALRRSLPADEEGLDLADQAFELHRLRVEGIAADVARLLLVAGHGVRRQ